MSLPTNMKYIDHGQGGPASCMQVKQGDLPQLKSGEVLIEVAYAGVNRPDVLQRAGAYPPPAGASPVLGLEIAGKIVAQADDVQEWKINDSVCALTPGGGYAEYCAVHAAIGRRIEAAVEDGELDQTAHDEEAVGASLVQAPSSVPTGKVVVR